MGLYQKFQCCGASTIAGPSSAVSAVRLCSLRARSTRSSDPVLEEKKIFDVDSETGSLLSCEDCLEVAKALLVVSSSHGNVVDDASRLLWSAEDGVNCSLPDGGC